MPVRYGTRYLPSFGFHAAWWGANLLGLDLFTGLGFSLRDESGTAILQVSPTVQQKWPALFDGLGCLTTFTHHPLVDPAMAPVIQPLRCLPLAFRDGVAAELTSLLEEGIIELWVSNLVVSKKKTDLCRFALVDFIRFRLSAEGIAPLSSNVEAILRIPELTSPAQVVSFLGMIAYLRFLPHYSHTTAPLRQLLRKDEPWGWSPA
ncbi:hypothetical protein SKAU_G00213980 [Synaphobranchus kaupii]|uniref:Uncharacterized protein n=1 Tax=Synaphobranchus kaupii TaxID=118154 RepID=A0A9Q1F9G2_SYNKA|nr:hypothetical protein SKAU_G00213980 [Synaphobranchus kaupii]